MSLLISEVSCSPIYSPYSHNTLSTTSRMIQTTATIVLLPMIYSVTLNEKQAGFRLRDTARKVYLCEQIRTVGSRRGIPARLSLDFSALLLWLIPTSYYGLLPYHIMAYYHIIIMADDLLLIKLLKVPVYLIRLLSGFLSVATYVPNYLLLYCVDALVFDPACNDTLRRYSLTWPHRFILIYLGVSVVFGECYGLYSLLDVFEQGLLVKIASVLFTGGGLLILMRKGYLSLIKDYNLQKLKSPMEHIAMLGEFSLDHFGILLTIVNTLLIIQIPNTLNYEYSPKKRNYISHICRLIHRSIQRYIVSFYMRVFFRVFPWRLASIQPIMEKEKDNLLRLGVLLSITACESLLDLLTLMVFGPFCLIYRNRTVFLERLKAECQWGGITVRHFGCGLLQIVQLSFIAVALISKPICGYKLMKLVVSEVGYSDMYLSQTCQFLLLCCIRPLSLMTLIPLYITQYKYRKYGVALGSPDNRTGDEVLMLVHFAELVRDTPKWVLIAGATLIKPWNYRWLIYIIKEDHNLDSEFVMVYFRKTLLDVLWMVSSLLLTVPVTVFDHGAVVSEARKAEIFLNMGSRIAAGVLERDILLSPSCLAHYSKGLYGHLISNMFSLPAYFITQCTFLSLLDSSLTPEKISGFLYRMMMLYYFQRVKRSVNFQMYSRIYERLHAAGLLQREQTRLVFWSYALKCQRHASFKAAISRLISPEVVGDIEKKVGVINAYSQISNIYWVRTKVTQEILLYILYRTIEIILTIFGVCVLLPLTLWRLPTFYVLFRFHQHSKQYFFPILKHVYISMISDILLLPARIAVALMAPFTYFQFVRQTSFQYGSGGIQTYDVSQENKASFLLQRILKTRVSIVKILLMDAFVRLLWIRTTTLGRRLAEHPYSLKSIWSEQVPDGIVGIRWERSPLFKTLLEIYTQTFGECMRDLPYFILMGFVLLAMPWRINYLIAAIVALKQDSTDKHHLHQLFRCFFRDYLCIVLIIVLLLSGFKTRRACILIRKNYHLNFFVGFLRYSFRKELVEEAKQMVWMSVDVLLLFCTLLFGWPHAEQILGAVHAIYKRRREEEEANRLNAQIHARTVENKQQLQVITKMGYGPYARLCAYLEVADLVRLQRVSKFNYIMGEREEIWDKQWRRYSAKYPSLKDNLKDNCIHAFRIEKSLKGKELLSYHQVIEEQFQKYIFRGEVSVKSYLKGRVSQPIYHRLFFDFAYSKEEGYGPASQLPQHDHEDEELLRITRQVRRPRVEYSEPQAWLNWLFYKPTEYLIQILHRFFSQDTNRRRKQVVFLLGAACLLGCPFLVPIFFFNFVFCLDSLVAIKILIMAHYAFLVVVIFGRIDQIYRRQEWVSLVPFDIKDDLVKAVRQCRAFISSNILSPASNKALQIENWIRNTIQQVGRFLRNKIVQFCRFLRNKIVQFWRFLSRLGSLFVDKVVQPLYISLSDKIRGLWIVMKRLSAASIRSLKLLLNGAGRLISSIWEGLKAMCTNLNGAYCMVLRESMRWLLRFGFAGELLFTLLGLALMSSPSIVCYWIGSERWSVVLSTVATMVLLVVGYKHLNRIKQEGMNDGRNQMSGSKGKKQQQLKKMEQ